MGWGWLVKAKSGVVEEEELLVMAGERLSVGVGVGVVEWRVRRLQVEEGRAFRLGRQWQYRQTTEEKTQQAGARTGLGLIHLHSLVHWLCSDQDIDSRHHNHSRIIGSIHSITECLYCSGTHTLSLSLCLFPGQSGSGSGSVSQMCRCMPRNECVYPMGQSETSIRRHIVAVDLVTTINTTILILIPTPAVAVAVAVDTSLYSTQYNRHPNHCHDHHHTTIMFMMPTVLCTV